MKFRVSHISIAILAWSVCAWADKLCEMQMRAIGVALNTHTPTLNYTSQRSRMTTIASPSSAFTGVETHTSHVHPAQGTHLVVVGRSELGGVVYEPGGQTKTSLLSLAKAIKNQPNQDQAKEIVLMADQGAIARARYIYSSKNELPHAKKLIEQFTNIKNSGNTLDSQWNDNMREGPVRDFTATDSNSSNPTAYSPSAKLTESLKREISTAEFLADLLRKPVIAPLGRVKYQFDSERQQLRIRVEVPDGKGNIVGLAPDKAFVRIHPNGGVEAVADPSPYMPQMADITTVVAKDWPTHPELFTKSGDPIPETSDKGRGDESGPDGFLPPSPDLGEPW